MKSFSRRMAIIASLTLAGCQTLPPEPQPAEPQVTVCPEVEPTICPVCPEVQCPDIKEAEAPIPVPAAPSTESLPVIGAMEWAFVEPGDILMEARVDTGAETSSLHAEDIQLLEKDGKRYVQFNLEHPETGHAIPVERRLHRRILVKQNVDAPPDRRYVVRMWVSLGKTRTWLDVSLTDREDFEYALLLGRNMLMDQFVVDVSKRHTLPKAGLKTESEAD